MKDCGQCMFSKVCSTHWMEFIGKQGAQDRKMGTKMQLRFLTHNITLHPPYAFSHTSLPGQSPIMHIHGGGCEDLVSSVYRIDVIDI